MPLNVSRFFKACNPSKILDYSQPDDRQYYIDFSSVRGGRIIEELRRTIALLSPDDPTCQLFTGHVGCGKSTELLRLKADLEQDGFHVVYFESDEDLDTEDVDVTEVLLVIVRRVSASLEAIGIRLRAPYLLRLLSEVADFLQTPVELNAQAELSLGIGKITSTAKSSPTMRSRLRQALEPRSSTILQAINDEVLTRAVVELKQRQRQGLVVLVDNLDRIGARLMPSGQTQAEYLFVDRGDQLRKLCCHVVYTIPLALIFSNASEILKNRLGTGVPPKVLSMVPSQMRNGQNYPPGMVLLRQMVMTRAFPELPPAEQMQHLPEVFDHLDTLDRLCWVSGGHVRNLLGLLRSCLQKQNPPFQREVLEAVIRTQRDTLVRAIDDDEWHLVFQVLEHQDVRGDAAYQMLLRSMFVFEYQDQQGSWFNINPALRETQTYQHWLAQRGTP